jgi:hypothetical protein
MNRWVPTDRRYRLPPRLAGYTRRPALKWIGMLVAWLIVTAILSISHLGALLLVIMAGLISYVVYAILRATPRAGRRAPDLAMGHQGHPRARRRAGQRASWPARAPSRLGAGARLSAGPAGPWLGVLDLAEWTTRQAHRALPPHGR